MHGYLGKLLRVDLSRGVMNDEPLNEAYVRDYIGGSGLAARYLWDMTDAATEPLSPEAPLIFMTGPLVGTAAPACGRHVVVALSPATGRWGESNTGGRFGAQLRYAGYDGIIVTGQAAHPVSLVIRDGVAELHDARHLWGKDIYATQEELKAEFNQPRASVACIGPGGEHRLPLAGIVNDEARIAARGGLGAVMGSKRLKAILAHGTGKIPLPDEARFREVVKSAYKELKEDFSVRMFRETGTAGGVDYLMMIGDMPNKYWTEGFFDGAEKLSGSVMKETIQTGIGACHTCPISCWRIVETRGVYKESRIDGPEYETVAAFGSLILSDDLEAVAYANHLCNSYGLDTISVGSTIAFAYYLFNQGIITVEDTGGLILRWGDVGTAIQLVGMIARQQGFGVVLGEGSRALGRRFGAEDLAVQVNGLEVAMHDPRAMTGMSLVYATSPRGACHNQGDMYWVELGRALGELGLDMLDRSSSEGKAFASARIQDWRSLYNSLIMCMFSNPDPHGVVGMLSAAIGREVSLPEGLFLGERAWNLKRIFNNRRGLSRHHDKLPKLLMEPMYVGGTEGVVPDFHAMLREYYDIRGWDWTSGRPTPAKLSQLGLDFALSELWPAVQLAAD
ncbi:MAG: aldehyde ferredoxin oxidoreductase family protein [Anaerolineae bacterium]|nr:aldehyde ferredoxin oxidoreductase family protein [Anaerolineae bacterium]